MTTFLTRSVLLLGAFALPLSVNAQEASASNATSIVVTAENQREWDRGNKVEDEGLADLAKAERDLVRYSAAVVNAQNSRDSSQARADNARRTFDSMLGQTEFVSGKDARQWAARLESTAKDWEKHSDDMEDAAKDLDRALDRQAKAQEEVDKAQAKITRGRAMMQAAERASEIERERGRN